MFARKTVFLWRSTGTYKKKLSCILSLPLHFSTVGSRTSYVCKKKMPSRRNLGHHLKDLNRCKAGIRIWTILIRWNKLNYFPFFNSDRIFSFLQNNILNRCTVSHCSVLIFIILKKTVNIDFYLMIQIRVSAKLCGSGYRPPHCWLSRLCCDGPPYCKFPVSDHIL